MEERKYLIDLTADEANVLLKGLGAIRTIENREDPTLNSIRLKLLRINDGRKE